MRFIPTRIHGVLDYLLGIVLILAPWLFGFAADGAETWVPVAVGIAILIYSFFTNYELGFVRSIPMGTHLTLDLLGGIFLAISPWLFGFADYVWVPHLVVGLVEIAAALMTESTPRRTRTGTLGTERTTTTHPRVRERTGP
ncbi:MAG TPA: SPW repeat protein [Planctomycetota bacterium]|nr:SPW repeat protein [Planctomycetota bacterium]